MKITYFHDGGHGWYSVKRSKLEQLGILSKITSFSYQRGVSVYLEEDCDASLFFNNLTIAEKDAIKIVESYKQNSPIRSYERFKLTHCTDNAKIS